jgi:AcrR family transcriptional regulator
MASSTTDQPARKRYPRAVRFERLLDVAEALFTERGYSGVTMEDIARAGGVSRPIVYSHFETREGAYLAVVRRARQQYDTQIAEAAGAVDLGPEQQLRAGAEVFFGLLEREPGRWKLIFGSSAVLPESHARELAELRFGTISTIELALRTAAPNAPELAITMAAHAVSGVGERLGLLWLARPDLPKSALVDHYVELLWNGMRPYVEAATQPK